MRSLIGKTVITVRNLASPPDQVAGGAGWAIPVGGAASAEEQMRAYGNNGTLFSIVNRLSTATGRVEWNLWRKAASGLDEDRTLITSHAALSLWNMPARPWYTRNRFVKTVTQHYDLTGEQWWLLVRDERMRSLGPLQMWPIRPDRMMPVPSRDKFIAGYIYMSPSGEKVPLQVEDVIFIASPNPLDPYRGMGPVQSIMVELDSARYTAAWNRNFFLNSAQPGGVIEVPTDLSDPEWEQLTQRWREQHKGVNAAHRVAVLENGAKWVPNTFTQRDMQFVELREVSRDALREAFGIPKFALGDVDDVNRATADASDAFFEKHLTEPRCDPIKEALNVQLLPMFYPGVRPDAIDVEFDYVSPIPPDLDREMAEQSAAVSAATALIGLGTEPRATFAAFGLPDLPMATVATPAAEVAAPAGPTAAEDARAQAEIVQKVYLGIGPILHWDEGRSLLARAGMPIDPFREPPEPPGAGGATPGAPDAGEDEPSTEGADGTDGSAPGGSGDSPVDARRPSHRMINSLAPVGWVDSIVPVGGARRPLNLQEIRSQVDVDGVQTDWTRTLDALMREWARATAEQRDRLADQVRAAVNSGDIAALAALGVTSSDAAAALLDALTDMSEKSADRVVREASEQGATIEPAPPEHGALTALATMTASLMAASLANTAAREASRWLGYGRDGDTVARAVTAHLESLSDAFTRANLGHALTRAQNMARTATFEQAQHAGHRVRWYASEVLDGATCKPCAKIDGKELPTIEAMILAYGGGPYLNCLGTIRCRGLAIGVWE